MLRLSHSSKRPSDLLIPSISRPFSLLLITLIVTAAGPRGGVHPGHGFLTSSRKQSTANFTEQNLQIYQSAGNKVNVQDDKQS